jgi:hypothetical protein
MSLGEEERLRCIKWLWAGDYMDCEDEILTLNPELEEQLDCRTSTVASRSNWGAASSTSTLPEVEQESATRRRTRLNFLAGLLARNKNLMVMPKHHILIGMQAKHKMLHRDLWDLLSAVRVLPSHNWVDGVVAEALNHNPGCSYPVLDWVTLSALPSLAGNNHFRMPPSCFTSASC